MTQPLSILLRGGLLFDDAGFRRGDLRIAGGRLVEVGEDLEIASSTVLETEGMVIAPSFADLHTHTRFPGDPASEDVGSVARAAVNGGYTHLLAMANTNPVPDSVDIYRKITGVLALAPIDIEQAASVTLDRSGDYLVDFERLSRVGARFFSDDGSVVARADIMFEALKLSSRLGVTIMEHAQDPHIGAGGSVNLGCTSEALGLAGIDEVAESVIVARDIELLRRGGGRLHLMHLSSKGSVDLLVQARAAGLDVTGEVTPHHLLLDDSMLRSFDTSFKVNPPIRSERTRSEALVDAALRGEFDVVSTDHAPHSRLSKERCIGEAPFGLIGLESAFSATFTALLERRIQCGDAPGGPQMLAVLGKVIELMSLRPRGLLGAASSLSMGMRADLVVLDPVGREVQRLSDIHSRSTNSPYLGMELRGSVMGCISRGRVLKWDGSLERGEQWEAL